MKKYKDQTGKIYEVDDLSQMIFLEQEIIPINGEMHAKKLRLRRGEVVISEYNEKLERISLKYLKKCMGELLTLINVETKTEKVFLIKKKKSSEFTLEAVVELEDGGQ